MNANRFEKEMARLKRRLDLLKLAREGRADVERVHVREYTVREHKVRAHIRIYYRKKP
jgi:hypothetical protein